MKVTGRQVQTLRHIRSGGGIFCYESGRGRLCYASNDSGWRSVLYTSLRVKPLVSKGLLVGERNRWVHLTSKGKEVLDILDAPDAVDTDTL